MNLPPLSVGIINYNGRAVILDTIRSLMQSDYPAPLEIIVADDCSTDDSLDAIREAFPNVRIATQDKNGGPNTVRNRALREAQNDIVFVTDNDITVAPNTLTVLVTELLASQRNGVATPLVLDSEDQGQIYANGAALHYVCFGIVPHRYTRVEALPDRKPFVNICGSGGIMLIRKGVARDLGWLDEDFIFGYDDGEFTFRVSSAGYDVIQVPAAEIYHLEKPGRRTDRLRFQIRGRWDLILKCYATRSLVLLAPALLFFELQMAVFLTLKGIPGEWLRGVGMVIGNFASIMKKRAIVQRMKQRPDRELLVADEILMTPSRKPSGLILKVKGMVEWGLRAYWALVSPLLTK